MTDPGLPNPPCRLLLRRLVEMGVFCLLLWLLSPTALGDADIRLDADLRGRLAALAPVTGKPLEADVFDRKVVVVSFFASWCPPCRAEFEHLNEIFHEFAGYPVKIAAVNVFEEWPGTDNQGRMARFLAEFAPQFAVLKGNETLRKAFSNVERIPTVFVFDRAGRPALHFVHARGAKKMNVEITELREAIWVALAERTVD